MFMRPPHNIILREPELQRSRERFRGHAGLSVLIESIDETRHFYQFTARTQSRYRVFAMQEVIQQTPTTNGISRFSCNRLGCRDSRFAVCRDSESE
jgi:hypothetical protein